MKLKVGAREKISGYRHPLTKPDILADARHIPLPKNSCDEIICEHPKFRCISRKLILKFKSLQFLADRFPPKVEKL